MNVGLQAVLRETQMGVDQELLLENVPKPKRKLTDPEPPLPPSKKNDGETATNINSDDDTDTKEKLKIVASCAPDKEAKPISLSTLLENLSDEQRTRLGDIEKTAQGRQMNIIRYLGGNCLIPVEMPGHSPKI